MPLVTALRNEETAIQARVYLAEIAERQPDGAVRAAAFAGTLGAARHRRTAGHVAAARAKTPMLQPLLKDPAPEVIEAASEAIRRLRGLRGGAPAAVTAAGGCRDRFSRGRR